jgi:hypothetical protein
MYYRVNSRNYTTSRNEIVEKNTLVFRSSCPFFIFLFFFFFFFFFLEREKLDNYTSLQNILHWLQDGVTDSVLTVHYARSWPFSKYSCLLLAEKSFHSLDRFNLRSKKLAGLNAHFIWVTTCLMLLCESDWLLKIRQICCPETSVRNYYSALRRIKKHIWVNFAQNGTLVNTL